MFNPNAASSKESGIFGLPYTVDDAKLILLPIPWEVTASYRKGTAHGPNAIFEASKQVDLYDSDFGSFYDIGIAMAQIPEKILALNNTLRPLAAEIIDRCGTDGDTTLEKNATTVNAGCDVVNQYVYDQVRSLRTQGKLVGLVGGEHSIPFGAFKAMLEEYPSMGILQIDAHADLRPAFEGFEHSHASIMYNATTKLPLKKLVQVGVRDFCEDELRMIESSGGKIQTFFDRDLAKKRIEGIPWKESVSEILAMLPKEVFISFDIDGLEPSLCPHTGTPVPGGLNFQDVSYLLWRLATSGKTIVGFDLNEVAAHPSTEWDGTVGSRILFKLCGAFLKSHQAKTRS